jgi:hypothetical protein
VTILEFVDALGRCAGQSWEAWRVVLAALFALPMTPEQRALFGQLTGRTTPPAGPAREAWLFLGRRAGKSLIAASIAVYLATTRSYAEILAPGERATVMILAADRRQARVLMRYVAGFFDGVPALAQLVASRTAEALHLSNQVSIEIHTASFRAVRGYTIIAALCDEICFWRDDTSANPDVEILNGLRPAMSTVPGALLLGISSPYARRGAAWEAYRAHYGRDESPVLVVQAATQTMNPTVDSAIIAAAYAADEAVAAAEYGAQWRRDVETFVSRETIDACVIPGRREMPPSSALHYVAFVDPSGGSHDSMTLAIAHSESGRAVLDLVRERKPPFSPEDVVREFAELLATYHVTAVTGDHYGGQWPQERFRAQGVAYTVAEQTRSELYRELGPRLTSGTVELLDHPRLLAQLASLERRTARGGRETVDHPPSAGAHDDVINAAAGALVLAARTRHGKLWTGLYADERRAASAGAETIEREAAAQRARHSAALLDMITNDATPWFRRE